MKGGRGGGKGGGVVGVGAGRGTSVRLHARRTRSLAKLPMAIVGRICVGVCVKWDVVVSSFRVLKNEL